MSKCKTFFKQLADFIKNIGIIYKVITGLATVIIPTVQQLTGFFTFEVAVPVWLLFAIPIFVWVVCKLLAFIIMHRIANPKFKIGDRVQIKGSFMNFYVAGYSFWNCSKVICVEINKQLDRKTIEEFLLENYTEPKTNSFVNHSRNRFF